MWATLFLNELELIYLHTNGFKYFYLIFVILFDTKHLFVHC